jgi:hypothetical protein
MPTLLELQHAMRRSLVQRDDGAASALLADGIAPDRLNIYRNTIVSGLTKALGLSFPAVQRLVGTDFFDSAARPFIDEHPPRAACLDLYGEEFPEFLRNFSPAASLSYLADVAELEWAVNCAIHARDIEPLDLAELAAIKPEEQSRISFVVHPSVHLLRAHYPVDHIWQAILAQDDGALASVNVDSGPICLLVERRATGVDVVRLDEPAWHFLTALCAGRPLQAALDMATDIDGPTALAEHLAVGRFVAFDLTAQEPLPNSREIAA